MGPLFVWDIEFIQNIYCIFCGRVCIRGLWFLPSCMFRVRVCGRPLETYVRMYVRPFSTKRRGKKEEKRRKKNIGEPGPAPAGLDAGESAPAGLDARESAPAGLDGRTYVRTYSARISLRELVPAGLNVRTYARTSPRESAPAGLDARTYVRTYVLRQDQCAGACPCWAERTYVPTYIRQEQPTAVRPCRTRRTYLRTYLLRQGQCAGAGPAHGSLPLPD